MRSKVFRYIAAGCFAGIAALNILEIIPNHINVHNLILIVGEVMVAVALFAAVPVLSAIGFAILSLLQGSSVLGYVLDGLPFKYIILYCLPLVFYVLLVVASLNLKSAKTLGIVAAATDIARFIMGIVFVGGGVTPRGLLFRMLYVVGAFSLGCAYKCIYERRITTNSTMVNTGAETSIATGSSKADDLLKLKALLDKGVITQEDFDAKKKQLLGL